MAIFKQVNQQIQAHYRTLDIELVRGDGYAYFVGNDGFDQIGSVYANPTTTSTEDMTRLALEAIEDRVGG
tara:strand:+ start:286 stop:495 length:210 start_codon:yes stop_codon:yes gene_type:complete